MERTIEWELNQYEYSRDMHWETVKDKNQSSRTEYEQEMERHSARAANLATVYNTFCKD